MSVYTPNAHLQLHFCSGFVVSEMLNEVTFVGEALPFEERIELPNWARRGTTIKENQRYLRGTVENFQDFFSSVFFGLVHYVDGSVVHAHQHAAGPATPRPSRT